MATAQNFNAKPPEPLTLVTDAVLNWKLCKQLWQNYAIVADIQSESRSPEFIKALFITTMGIEGLQIYNACDPEYTDTVDEIIKKLDEHILGQTNETFERYKFNARGQMCEEAIDAYVAALKILQKTCNFCDCLKDSLLRDRIVFGVRDNGVRKRLLQERSLDLSRCIDICRTHENTTSQMKLITDTGEEVHRVEERRHFTNKRQHGRGQFRQQKQERTTFPTPTRPIVNCKFCGRQHERKKEMCPAWGQVCSKCNKRNHFSRCCPPDVRSKVHVIDEQSSDVEYEVYEDSVLTVYTDESIRHVSTGPLYTEMMLPNKTAIKLQIDSGATVNVISAKHVDINNVTSSGVKLKMYNNTSLKPLGKCLLLLQNPANGKKHCVEFQVVEEDFIPLLSRRAAEGMGLMTVNYNNFRQLHAVTTKCDALTEEFKSVFDAKTLGCLKELLL